MCGHDRAVRSPPEPDWADYFARMAFSSTPTRLTIYDLLHTMTGTQQAISHAKANKTDAGNGSKAICRVSKDLRSPSPDPKRSPKKYPRCKTNTI